MKETEKGERWVWGGGRRREGERKGREIKKKNIKIQNELEEAEKESKRPRE